MQLWQGGQITSVRVCGTRNTVSILFSFLHFRAFSLLLISLSYLFQRGRDVVKPVPTTTSRYTTQIGPHRQRSRQGFARVCAPHRLSFLYLLLCCHFIFHIQLTRESSLTFLCFSFDNAKNILSIIVSLYVHRCFLSFSSIFFVMPFFHRNKIYAFWLPGLLLNSCRVRFLLWALTVTVTAFLAPATHDVAKRFC